MKRPGFTLDCSAIGEREGGGERQRELRGMWKEIPIIIQACLK
jgi:hypothetical protein